MLRFEGVVEIAIEAELVVDEIRKSLAPLSGFRLIVAVFHRVAVTGDEGVDAIGEELEREVIGENVGEGRQGDVTHPVFEDHRDLVLAEIGHHRVAGDEIRIFRLFEISGGSARVGGESAEGIQAGGLVRTGEEFLGVGEGDGLRAKIEEGLLTILQTHRENIPVHGEGAIFVALIAFETIEEPEDGRRIEEWHIGVVALEVVVHRLRGVGGIEIGDQTLLAQARSA